MACENFNYQDIREAYWHFFSIMTCCRSVILSRVSVDLQVTSKLD